MKEIVKKFIPAFLLEAYHKFWPFFGAVVYGFPSRELIVVGVTGTNGKTTVVEWTARILQEAGYKVASASSVRFTTGEREKLNMLKMTMPGRMKLQKFLRDAVSAGCKYAVLEVTSEGIAQHRHSFIDFDAAVFANISPEHIERHGGFEKYKIAKGELFRALKNSKPKILNSKQIPNSNPQIPKVSIVNIDDKNAEYFLQFPADEKWGFTISDCRFQISNCIKANDATSSLSGVDFKVDDIQFHIPIIGGFNVYNALAAICVGLSQGGDLATCARALGRVRGVPGRMEIVAREPFTVIVDYAHTPVALENVYKTIRDIYKLQTTNYKLVCVLGAAGGGRDKWKRPELGRIAARYCDAMILTNEDPYDEDPSQILSQIKSGISKLRITSYGLRVTSVYEILDRREAIRKALELAGAGDAVVITGKGSEPWMCVAGGKKIPWDDRAIAREESCENNT